MSITKRVNGVGEFIRTIVDPVILGFRHLFRPRQTIKYPFEYYEPADGYRGRIINDLEKCINCMLCARICPDKCISQKIVEGKKWPEIDFGRCCFCGFCVWVCPPDSLQMTKAHSFPTYNKEDLFYEWDELGEYPDPSSWRVGKEIKQKRIHHEMAFE